MVNRRGEFLTRDVNINSNLDAVFASTHNACVRPRSLLFAFLMFTEIIEFKPILKFIFELAWAIQRIRRLVTIRDPLSPLFPFVSSTELIESMTFSPLLQASRGGFESNRSSLSCQIYSTTFSFPFILARYSLRTKFWRLYRTSLSSWEDELFRLRKQDTYVQMWTSTGQVRCEEVFMFQELQTYRGNWVPVWSPGLKGTHVRVIHASES